MGKQRLLIVEYPTKSHEDNKALFMNNLQKRTFTKMHHYNVKFLYFDLFLQPPRSSQNLPSFLVCNTGAKEEKGFWLIEWKFISNATEKSCMLY